MAKIVGGKFKLAWDASTEPDVVGYMLFFGATPEITYESPSIPITGKDTVEFDSANTPEGFVLPVDVAAEVVYASIAAVDDVGNLSDLLTPMAIPFDATAPAPVTGFHLV